MSAVQIIHPLIVIRCDADDCPAEFVPQTEWDRGSERAGRWAAHDAGWQVRPNGGKGSRTAPDLCPEHCQDGGDQR